jgi:hypothetical protein
MQRQAITNGNGMWFDVSKATCFKEEKQWNGQNYISKATGSQWYHEAIYYTKSGKWVLNKWSDYQGSIETYEVVEEHEVVEWFLKQSMDLPTMLEGQDIYYEI